LDIDRIRAIKLKDYDVDKIDVFQRLILFLCNYNNRTPRSLLNLSRNVIRKTINYEPGLKSLPKQLESYVREALKPEYKHILKEFTKSTFIKKAKVSEENFDQPIKRAKPFR
jgi:hypothetical protein